MSNDLAPNSENNLRLLPGGVPSLLPDSYIVRGKGGRVWNQNGKVFIDLICGYGTMVLGHCHPEVNQAAVAQMERGTMFPTYHPLYEELTTVLKRIFPYADQSLLVKTGSEAVSAAIRLARAYTGKNKIIRCGFHGWHDAVVSPHVSWHQYEANLQPPRLVAGIPKANSASFVIRWDGVDLQHLKDLFKTHHSSVAALLLDPVQLREPIEENIRQLRQMTRDESALFILDEAKTGFRVSLAGVQGLYKIEPDLTILSKAMSNGFPLSAVIGCNEILNLLASVKVMGTFNGELLSIAAALKTIAILEREDNISTLGQIGRQLLNGVNEILKRHELLDDVQAVAYRWPCMPYIWFRNNSEKAQRLKPIFYRRLIQCGVMMLANHMNFVCLAHTKHDVEETLQIIEDSLDNCIFKEGVYS